MLLWGMLFENNILSNLKYQNYVNQIETISRQDRD